MGQIARAGGIKTDVPARMDRLPWGRWHRMMVIALGVTWAFNGVGVAVVAADGAALGQPQSLGLSALQVGYAATIYLFGTIVGALILGYEADGFGRKRLILIGAGVHAAGTLATALSWSYWSFALFRFLTGFGVGGQYTAINSLVNELAPARVRGRASLAVSGGYWFGAIVGIGATIALLNPAVLPVALGWRVSFAVALLPAMGLLLLQRSVPESPRWVMLRRGPGPAGTMVGGIEQRIRQEEGLRELPRPAGALALRPERQFDPTVIPAILFRMYPRRSAACFLLMAGQAFLYNAIFFTYALLLSRFYGVAFHDVGIYLVGLGVGSLAGPWLLGGLFDGVGRRTMIAGSYVASGVLLGITGYLFSVGLLDATTQTIAWAVILFFASAGAGAAYLSISELFPLELRATTAGILYALGTAVGGLVGPALFAGLIETGSATRLFNGGYLVGAILMVVAGLAELPLGVDAERRPLESVARPLLAEAAREQPVAPRRKKGRRRAA
jgi:MFS family permease